MRQTRFSRRGPHSTSPLQPGRFQIGTRSPHTDSTDTRPRRLALPPPLLTSGHDCGVQGGWDPNPDVNSPDYRVMSARWCSRRRLARQGSTTEGFHCLPVPLVRSSAGSLSAQDQNTRVH
ncbi:hypothetical protein Bbelb_239210 [Branchiostoma belcheri]|nr:hypothetical protein Bbelb_239210 [Branchiostoma belcheri]